VMAMLIANAVWARFLELSLSRRSVADAAGVKVSRHPLLCFWGLSSQRDGLEWR
jgi:hypothetical protein